MKLSIFIPHKVNSLKIEAGCFLLTLNESFSFITSEKKFYRVKQ